MTTIYLATIEAGEQTAALLTYSGKERKPGVLVSFHYLSKKISAQLDQFDGYQKMLDSGAFTAHTKGKKVDMDALINEAKTGRWTTVAALDVIGDYKASLTNALAMRDAGVQVMPTFHYGEPWDLLKTYAQEFDKVALGGLVPVRSQDEKTAWVAECFARIWPKKLHCFGWVQEEPLMQFPFHSADSSSWALMPHGFGRWASFGGQKLGLNRAKSRAAAYTNLAPEVEFYVKLQDKIRARWRDEFRRQGWL